MISFTCYPVFSKITKSKPTAIMLSYIVELTHHNNPTRITNEQLAKDLHFNITTIMKCKSKMKNLPFIEISVAKVKDEYEQVIGIISQYEIDIDKLVKYMEKFENE